LGFTQKYKSRETGKTEKQKSKKTEKQESIEPGTPKTIPKPAAKKKKIINK